MATRPPTSAALLKIVHTERSRGSSDLRAAAENDFVGVRGLEKVNHLGDPLGINLVAAAPWRCSRRRRSRAAKRPLRLCPLRPLTRFARLTPVENHVSAGGENLLGGVPDEFSTVGDGRAVVRMVVPEIVDAEHPLVQSESDGHPVGRELTCERSLARAGKPAQQMDCWFRRSSWRTVARHQFCQTQHRVCPHTCVAFAGCRRPAYADNGWRTVIISGFYDSIGLSTKSTDAEKAIADRWLALLGMSDRADEPFNRLSYGDQRLILIARA